MRNIALKLVKVLPNLACAATLLAFGATWWFPFEYLCHFRVQFAAVLFCGAIAALCRKRLKLAAVWMAFMIINLCLILPFYFDSPGSGSSDAELRLVALNVEANNADFGRARGFLLETNPDVVVLVEVNRPWAAELEPLLAEFPYSAEAATDTDNGVCIFSQHPIMESAVESIKGRQAIVARLEVVGRSLTIVGAHTWPPMTPQKIRDRNKQLMTLADILRHIDGPAMLAGDFNTTSWSPAFGDLLDRSGLRDSRYGFGVQPTWPAWLPLPQIPIDHVLVSDDIVVTNRETGKPVGSDHLPVIVDFYLDD